MLGLEVLGDFEGEVKHIHKGEYDDDDQPLFSDLIVVSVHSSISSFSSMIGDEDVS